MSVDPRGGFAAARLRDAIATRYAWVALLAVFAICFIPSNSTGATNLYRLFIVVPMLLCFRPTDLAPIWREAPARWFLLLCGWLSLTLLWDGWSHKDFKLLLRELNTLALFYLAFLIGHHHRTRVGLLLDGWVVIGLIGALLILWDWPELWVQAPNHHWGSVRGVFEHHVLVGWAVAAVALVALYRYLTAVDRTAVALHGGAALVLGVLVFWIQARGAYAVLGCGGLLLIVLWWGPRAAAVVAAAAVAVVVLVLVLAFHPQLELVADALLRRGTANRPAAWQQGWQQILASGWRLWFGQGFSTDPELEMGGWTAAHYHNLMLNQLFYAGVVGLMLYLGWLGSLLHRAIRDPGLRLWAVLVVAMQVGFITDGDRLFVNPSAMLLAFLLPAFLLGFRVPAPGPHASARP